MLRPEGSRPGYSRDACPTGSATRHRAGRHAPPLEVRQDRQRRRLYAAAGAVFARVGYADATAEAIAREAGMSKATFYEHFDNKEECIIALFDAATEAVLEAMRRTGDDYAGRRPRPGAPRAVIHTFLEVLAAFPDEAQTLLVEIIGAGPRAMERRDRVLAEYAAYVDDVNRADASRGSVPRFATPHDAFAIVGAVVELASRQIRTGQPDDIRDLEPVVERLVLGPACMRRRGAGVSAAELAALEARDPRLPALPAAGGVARAGGAREARRVPRRDLLGPPDRRLRRPGRARAAARPRARGARRQPHGPRVHRRPLGRLPLRRAAPDRLRQPADVAPRAATASRSRTAHHRRGALRAAGEQAAAGRARRTALPGCVPSCALLERVRVVVCLGAFAWEPALRLRAALGGLRARGRASATAPRPPAERLTLLGCFHPSQQNTFTGS